WTGCQPGSTRCAATRPIITCGGWASCATRTAAAGRGSSTTGCEREIRCGSAGRGTTSSWWGSPRYQFVAGGIGITPILPMIAAASAAGADWRLLYGGRYRASMAFLPELARYGDRVTVAPQDETGLLDLDALLGTPQPDT